MPVRDDTWESRWFQWARLAGGEEPSMWNDGVAGAYAELEGMLVEMRIYTNDYGSILNACNLLAEEFDVALPGNLGEAIDVRHGLSHTPRVPLPSRERAQEVQRCFERTWRELCQYPDREPPDAMTITRIKEDLKRGREKRKLLGIKTRWEEYRREHSDGSIVPGVVVKLHDRSAVLRLAPGVLGRVDVSEISATHHVNAPEEELREGQEVEAQIVRFVEGSSRIILSIKAVQASRRADAERKRAEEVERCLAEQEAARAAQWERDRLRRLLAAQETEREKATIAAERAKWRDPNPPTRPALPLGSHTQRGVGNLQADAHGGKEGSVPTARVVTTVAIPAAILIFGTVTGQLGHSNFHLDGTEGARIEVLGDLLVIFVGWPIGINVIWWIFSPRSRKQ